MTATVTHMSGAVGELMPEKAVLKQWPCLSLDGLRAARAARLITWTEGKRKSAWYYPADVDLYIEKHLSADAAPHEISALAEVFSWPPAPGPRGSQVYFIYCAATKAIKIGIGRTASRRLSNLQSGCAEKLVLLGWFWGTEEDERAAHVLFHEFRLSGEWFRDCQRLRTFIAEKVGG